MHPSDGMSEPTSPCSCAENASPCWHICCGQAAERTVCALVAENITSWIAETDCLVHYNLMCLICLLLLPVILSLSFSPCFLGLSASPDEFLWSLTLGLQDIQCPFYLFETALCTFFLLFVCFPTPTHVVSVLPCIVTLHCFVLIWSYLPWLFVSHVQIFPHLSNKDHFYCKNNYGP